MPGQVQHNDLSETNNTASCSSITYIMIANVLEVMQWKNFHSKFISYNYSKIERFAELTDSEIENLLVVSIFV